MRNRDIDRIWDRCLAGIQRPLQPSLVLRMAKRPAGGRPDVQSYDLSSQRAPVSAASTLRDLAEVADSKNLSHFDVYGAGSALQDFEGRVAEILGKPAAAFFPTGTCAQHAALLALSSGTAHLGVGLGKGFARPTVALHPTSHLVFLDCLRDGHTQLATFEERARANLPDFEVHAVGDMWRELRLADVEAALRIPSPCGVAAPAIRVLVIELPQRMNGGKTAPLEELREISALCRQKGVKLHCDGARLWEVAPYYGVPCATLASLFDSVYVSFYKGVGALSGAMLAGSAQLVADAKVWQKRRGSNAFTFGPAALSCECHLERALDGTVLGFDERLDWLRRMAATVTSVAAEAGNSAAAPFFFFDPPTPQSAMVHGYLKGDAPLLEAAHERARERTGVRLWNALRGRGHAALPQMGGGARPVEEVDAVGWQYFEWSAGPANAAIPEEVAERGWRAFFAELRAQPAQLPALQQPAPQPAPQPDPQAAPQPAPQAATQQQATQPRKRKKRTTETPEEWAEYRKKQRAAYNAGPERKAAEQARRETRRGKTRAIEAAEALAGM